MMTKQEKEHKIKLIYLIMLVNTEYAKRKPFKNVWEIIDFAIKQVRWAVELKNIVSQKAFESGGLEIVSGDKKPEIVSNTN